MANPYSLIKRYGIGQLEWKYGEFENQVVDRHNKAIIKAYEMGVDSCRKPTGCSRCGVGVDNGAGTCPFCAGVTEEQILALKFPGMESTH